MKKITIKNLENIIKKTIQSFEKIDKDFFEKAHSGNLTTEDIQRRLTIYKVVRSFKCQDGKKESHNRFKPLLDYLNKNKTKLKNEHSVKVVNELNKFIITNYKVNAISASSKLLCPFNPKIIIYDQNAVHALKKMGAIGIKDNYEYFYEAWMEKYDEEFKTEVSKLMIKSEKFSIGINSNDFCQRVFDKYLWEIGS